jgi:hypothetical protein
VARVTEDLSFKILSHFKQFNHKWLMATILNGSILDHWNAFGFYLSEMGSHKGFCVGQYSDLTYIFKGSP